MEEPDPLKDPTIMGMLEILAQTGELIAKHLPMFELLTQQAIQAQPEAATKDLNPRKLVALALAMNAVFLEIHSNEGDPEEMLRYAHQLTKMYLKIGDKAAKAKAKATDNTNDPFEGLF